jgi:hypothetical protein
LPHAWLLGQQVVPSDRHVWPSGQQVTPAWQTWLLGQQPLKRHVWPLGQQTVPDRQTWLLAQQVPLMTVPAQEHCPLVHVWPEAQVVKQAPQLLGSEVVSTQVPLQPVSPVGQESTHVPPPQSQEQQVLPSVHAPPLAVHGVMHVALEHVWPEAQIVPHAPQLLESVCSSTHTPLQEVKPLAQTQAEFTHVSLDPQTVPQAPQSLALEVVSTQVPEQQTPPLQGELSGTLLGNEHWPLEGLHIPATWHSFAGQVTGSLGVHWPLWQV